MSFDIHKVSSLVTKTRHVTPTNLLEHAHVFYWSNIKQ